jgi:hypothetical protein
MLATLKNYIYLYYKMVFSFFSSNYKPKDFLGKTPKDILEKMELDNIDIKFFETYEKETPASQDEKDFKQLTEEIKGAIKLLIDLKKKDKMIIYDKCYKVVPVPVQAPQQMPPPQQMLAPANEYAEEEDEEEEEEGTMAGGARKRKHKHSKKCKHTKKHKHKRSQHKRSQHKRSQHKRRKHKHTKKCKH